LPNPALPERIRVIGLATAVAILAPATAGRAASDAGPDRAAIEMIVREYILAHPDVILDSLRAYEAARRAEEEKGAAAALAASREAIERDPAAPVAGNPNGNVTVVEFFDYQCGYCKRVLPVMQELLKTDPNVRFVFKEFPILGPESVTAARAALAVWATARDKYVPFHTALMQSRGGLSEERIMETAKGVGLDVAKLRSAMAEPAIEETLQRNLEVGRAINVNGTPAFLIGGRLVPGALDLETMRRQIAQARAG
jgi:protein-disulfide isomerase